jgi:CyaY protein
MTSESEFVSATDRTLAAIGNALDAAVAESDAEIDWTQNDGILEIECADGGKLIVNRHLPNREIWVAAKTGGFHFAAVGGLWRDTRSGDELGSVLTRLLRGQAGIELTLPPLGAPL